jgi:hypothetical protein
MCNRGTGYVNMDMSEKFNVVVHAYEGVGHGVTYCSHHHIITSFHIN